MGLQEEVWGRIWGWIRFWGCIWRLWVPLALHEEDQRGLVLLWGALVLQWELFRDILGLAQILGWLCCCLCCFGASPTHTPPPNGAVLVCAAATLRNPVLTTELRDPPPSPNPPFERPEPHKTSPCVCVCVCVCPLSPSDDDIVFEDFARQRLKGMKDDKEDEEERTNSPQLNDR